MVSSKMTRLKKIKDKCFVNGQFKSWSNESHLNKAKYVVMSLTFKSTFTFKFTLSAFWVEYTRADDALRYKYSQKCKQLELRRYAMCTLHTYERMYLQSRYVLYPVGRRRRRTIVYQRDPKLHSGKGAVLSCKMQAECWQTDQTK